MSSSAMVPVVAMTIATTDRDCHHKGDDGRHGDHADSGSQDDCGFEHVVITNSCHGFTSGIDIKHVSFVPLT